MILLDTNVVVAFLNGNESVSGRIRHEIDQISLSTLVIAELDFGARVSRKSKENLEKLYRFLDVVQIVPNKPTGEVDALITATAIAQDAILATGNRRHFENTEGLKLEVWRIE